MSILYERAPLGFIQGKDVMITPEWFRNLNQILDSITSGTSGLTAAQLALLASIPGLVSQISNLTNQMTTLITRVNALDGGFQS